MKEYYVILTPFFPSAESFVGPFVYDQAKAIQQVSNYEVVVVKLVHSGADKVYNYQGITVYQTKIADLPSFVLPGLFMRKNSRKLLNKFNEITNGEPGAIKFVHGHVAYACGVLAVNLAKMIGTASVVQHHGLDVMGYTNGRFQNSRLLKKLNEYWINASHVTYLNQATWNIGVSQKTLDALNAISAYKPTREYVLFNGINKQKFYPVAGQKSPQYFTIGCVANFWSTKDQLTLLKAVSYLMVREGYTDIRLKFVGTGPTLKQCMAFVDDNNMQSSVEFLTTQDHTQMNAFYNSLNLFVLPSYYEAFGCVYTEAHACGVPFIGVVGQGIEELVSTENRSWQLIQPSQAEELADRIDHFYKNRGFNPELNQDIDINKLVEWFLSNLSAQ